MSDRPQLRLKHIVEIHSVRARICTLVAVSIRARAHYRCVVPGDINRWFDGWFRKGSRERTMNEARARPFTPFSFAKSATYVVFTTFERDDNIYYIRIYKRRFRG